MGPFFPYQQTSAACFGGGGTKFGSVLCLAVTRTPTPFIRRPPAAVTPTGAAPRVPLTQI